MKQNALSLLIYAVFGASALAMFPLMLLAALAFAWDPTRRYPGRLIRRYGRFLSRCVPTWKFSVEGRIPKDIDRHAYVVIANHESTGDIFLLSSVPWDMRWVAKAELLRIPLMGQMLWLCGDIPLKRGNKKSVLQMLETCRQTLRRGLSVMIFPEGTRSKDGCLGRFKDGAFQLAIEAGVPILPIALTGTRQCWARRAFALGRAHARVQILDPIPTAGMDLAALPALRDEARRRIGAALGRMRSEEAAALQPPPAPSAPPKGELAGADQPGAPPQ